MFNEVIIVGKLVEKPVVKETSHGVRLLTMVLDVERPYRNNLGFKDHDYINCICWKGLSESVNDICEVGSILGVKGRLQSKNFEGQDNQTISALEVKVEHVVFLDRYFKNA